MSTPQATSTRPLGRSGIAVSLLSFGAAPIGNFMRPFTESGAREMVDQAWDLGIRFYDTAPMYGHGLSEHRLGGFLRDHDRNEYVLASKAGRVLTPAAPGTFDSGLWTEPPPLKATFDYSYDGIMRAVEDSLQRLLTDHLEIVYMHDTDRYTHGDAQPEMFERAVTEGFSALAKLRDEGVVKAIGFGVNEADVMFEAISRTDCDAILLAGRYTLLEQEPLDDLLPTCAERGIGVVLGGVYNSGILATGAIEGAKFNYAIAPDEVRSEVSRIEEVCRRYDVALPAAALAFAAAHPAVSSVCIGSRTTGQQAQTAELFDAEIPTELWADLRSAGLIREDAPTPA